MLSSFDQIQIEAHEHYIKGGFRNRFCIATANGIASIGIPLRKGKNEGQSIKSVEIAYETDWQRQSWNTIKSAYQRAPFFEHYAESVQPLLTHRHKYLYDLNWESLHLILRWLKWPTTISESEIYQKTEQTLSAVDFRNKMKVNNRSEFESKPYPQVFEDKWGFISNLSILDLLFCMGPEAAKYLTI